MCVDDQKLQELQKKPIDELTQEEREALARMLREIEEETEAEREKSA